MVQPANKRLVTEESGAIKYAPISHNQSADTIVDGVTNHTFTAADDTKLGTIATSATNNATDAQLRDLATHTGSLNADMLSNGATNHVFSNVDNTKLMNIATAATANSTDAALFGLAAHTGTLSADKIVDGVTNHTFTAADDTKLGTITSGANVNLAVGTTVGTVAAGNDVRFSTDGMINALTEGIVADVRDINGNSTSSGNKLVALQAAANKARDQKRTLFLPPGDYRISGTLILQCSVEASGVRILQTATSAITLQLGVRGVTIMHETLNLPMVFPEGAAAYTGIGIQVVDMDACNIWIPWCSGFNTGLHLYGDGQGTYQAGISYNTFTIGQIDSFTTNVVMEGTNPGWVTQNTFIGGRFSMCDPTYTGPGTGRGDRVSGTRHVRIGIPGGPMGIGNCGQHVFTGCSFEGRVPEYEIECYDADNLFLNCRWESGLPGGGNIIYRDNGAGGLPSAVGNIIMGGREADKLNITYNSLSVDNTLFTGRQVGAPDGSIAIPGMAFQNDMDTGFYRNADNSFRGVCGGTEMLMMTSSSASLMYRGVTRAESYIDGFQFAASSAALAGGSLRIPIGVAPTTPVSGAVWMNGTGMCFQIGSQTHTLDDTGWVVATLGTGWSVYAGQTPGYRRLNQVTHMRGQATSTGSTNVAFILPTGYRPIVQMQVTSANSVGGVLGALVTPTGQVAQNAAAAVTGFSFSAIPPFMSEA